MKFELKECIEILSRTPKVLESLLSELNDQWVHANEGDDTWSPFDIVGHLIHGEKTDWIPRSRAILEDELGTSFQPFDRFAQFENSKGKNLDQLLIEFSLLRKGNMKTLKELEIDSEKLLRTGIHPAFGEVTLQQLLATWTAHDFSHIHQLTRVLAKNYKEEVGPWKEYISILK
ncbi:MAG: DinB family protein [Flavobacteriales bacterium]|nr:DinB family protein [Flavobacteriales bacterium]